MMKTFAASSPRFFFGLEGPVARSPGHNRDEMRQQWHARRKEIEEKIKSILTPVTTEEVRRDENRSPETLDRWRTSRA
ncbi:MAG: hypothetical protein ACE5IY_09705 [bacterium]